MNLIDLLRKLGILRFGTYKGTYSSAKDMPDGMFMDDVYDAKKDLAFQKDLSKSTNKAEGK
jgi:hypothetical protein